MEYDPDYHHRIPLSKLTEVALTANLAQVLFALTSGS